jgi:hypothetical protein
MTQHVAALGQRVLQLDQARIALDMHLQNLVLDLVGEFGELGKERLGMFRTTTIMSACDVRISGWNLPVLVTCRHAV